MKIIFIMILLPSHSSSVKSVTSIEGKSGEYQVGESPVNDLANHCLMN